MAKKQMTEEEKNLAADPKGLCSEKDGVIVGFNQKTKEYVVECPGRYFVRRNIQGLEGAEFDRDIKAWRVPMNSEGLDEGIVKTRSANAKVEKSRQAIQAAVQDVYHDEAIPYYAKKDKPLLGEIIAVNEFFTAQNTGNLFVAIHDTDRLLGKDCFNEAKRNEVLEVGSKKYIKYNEKGFGEISDYKPKKVQEVVAQEKPLEAAPEAEKEPTKAKSKSKTKAVEQTM